jgi:phosphoglucomutase
VNALAGDGQRPLIDPRAGQPATAASLVNVHELLVAYSDRRPDPTVPGERVAFGTSGHRGSSLECSFNEWHVLAITQAICEYRARTDTTGPLFIGIDTHALSGPAFASALEVLAANGIEALIAPDGEYTPTPAISHAILQYNRGRHTGLADGIVVTPSHNPPESGGFKYNPAHGGPADAQATGWIEARANALLGTGLAGVRRVTWEQARRAASTHVHDFITAYVGDLGSVLDLALVRRSGLRLGVDPLGGAGVHYWPRIAEQYGLDLTVISDAVDPTFRFMTLDWDGRIRMDPSSAWAMQRLIGLKGRYDVAFACDTDHDRHGVVTPEAGLLPANHYLSVAIDYLLRHRLQWRQAAAVGKTVVTSSLVDRVAARQGRTLYEVPVGFKWFVAGLLDGTLGFGCEESAGASFARIDGSVWTTDKDGIAAALLSAEMTARTGHDPGELYRRLVHELGEPFADRVEAPATTAQKARLSKLSPQQITGTDIAGDSIVAVIDRAPGNQAPIGGIKVSSASGWFAARPSGTEDIYKIYAESFRSPAHLHSMVQEAQRIVDTALASP